MGTKEEVKEVRNCPSCGVENPKYRITCMVCHERMDEKVMKGVAKDAPKDTPKGEKPKAKDTTGPPKTPKGGTLNPFETAPPKTQAPPAAGKTNQSTLKKSMDEIASGPIEKQPMKPIKRRRRTKA